MSSFASWLFNKIDNIQASPKKFAVVRIQYGKLGQVLTAQIKITSGDKLFDQRAINSASSSTVAALHHPGKNKGRRINQWNEIRYTE